MESTQADPEEDPEMGPTKCEGRRMIPDAVFETGGLGWFGKEKSHWEEFAAG
jgi:hypothetical protein